MPYLGLYMDSHSAWFGFTYTICISGIKIFSGCHHYFFDNENPENPNSKR